MKKYFKFLFCFILIISALISTAAFSAEIETGKPEISGQFLLKYKPSVKHSLSDGSVVSNTQTDSQNDSENILTLSDDLYLPDFEECEEYTEYLDTSDLILDIPENTRRIDERDGETLYQIEPDYSSFETTEYPIALFSATAEAEAYIGEKRTFKTLDYTTNQYVYDDFTCFFISEHCEVFVQDSLSYSDTEDTNTNTKTNMSELIGNKFGDIVKPYIISHLADYTGYYGDKNGKIIILLENIKDDYGVNGYAGYTAGYFLQDTKTLHIDTYPLMKPTPESTVNTAPTDESIANAFPTVAHEFTHMIETSITNNASFKCIWFAELFAISTEASLFPEETAANEYTSYVNGSYYIKHGAVVNFKDYSVNGNVIGANYGLLYMFQNYLRGLTLEADGETKVFYNILKHTKIENTFEDAVVAGINETLETLEKDYTFTDFDDLIKSFYIAFMLQEQNDDKYYYYSEYSDIQNLTIPLSTSTAMYNNAGAAVVYPLLNDVFTVPDNEFEYIAFSYSDTPEITSVQYPDSVYSFLTIQNAYIQLPFPEPYFAVNGYMNCFFEDNKLYLNSNCYNLLKGVCFVSYFDGFLPLRDGSYKIIGITYDNFRLDCYSLNNSAIYDVVRINFDSESAIQISSFASFPEISDYTMDFKIRYLSKKDLGTIKLYSAIYDRETNMLLGANSESFEANKLTMYVNKDMPSVTFTDTESGKYLLKIFAFDGDKTIAPLSSPYELGFSKKQ